MSRKAQSAMEFLFNYGWAILVLAAAIAALSYFGVFNPSGSSIDTCITGPGFSCTSYKATTTDFTLTLRSSVYDLSYVGLGFSGDVFDCASATAENKAVPDLPDTGVKTNKWWFNGTGEISKGIVIAKITFEGCTFARLAQSDFGISFVKKGESVMHTLNGQANLQVGSS